MARSRKNRKNRKNRRGGSRERHQSRLFFVQCAPSSFLRARLNRLTHRSAHQPRSSAARAAENRAPASARGSENGRRRRCRWRRLRRSRRRSPSSACRRRRRRPSCSCCRRRHRRRHHRLCRRHGRRAERDIPVSSGWDERRRRRPVRALGGGLPPCLDVGQASRPPKLSRAASPPHPSWPSSGGDGGARPPSSMMTPAIVKRVLSEHEVTHRASIRSPDARARADKGSGPVQLTYVHEARAARLGRQRAPHRCCALEKTATF